METFFLSMIGISQEVFSYFILPFLIFLARIGDYALATDNGRRSVLSWLRSIRRD